MTEQTKEIINLIIKETEYYLHANKMLREDAKRDKIEKEIELSYTQGQIHGLNYALRILLEKNYIKETKEND